MAVAVHNVSHGHVQSLSGRSIVIPPDHRRELDAAHQLGVLVSTMSTEAFVEPCSPLAGKILEYLDAGIKQMGRGIVSAVVRSCSVSKSR